VANASVDHQAQATGTGWKNNRLRRALSEFKPNASWPRHDQRRTKRDLDEAGQNHHDVLVDPDPVRQLSLKAVTGERQMAEPGGDESTAEDDARSGANATCSGDVRGDGDGRIVRWLRCRWSLHGEVGVTAACRQAAAAWCSPSPSLPKHGETWPSEQVRRFISRSVVMHILPAHDHFVGAPGRIRTSDLRFRNPTLRTVV
jgi:hypothetical protein